MIYDIILKMLKASYADMAKLADALASGANRGNSVQVQVLLSAFIFSDQRTLLLRCPLIFYTYKTIISNTVTEIILQLH